MTVSAHDIAAVLRERHPGLPEKKLHKLLYYCQGHHLAAFGRPLFRETISAWDIGPVVDALWRRERDGGAPADAAELDEAQLNTVGYVLSRYGALTGRDLEHLTHSETPWRLADRGRRPGQSARIELAWIEEYFRASDGPDAEEEDEPVPDPATVRQWLVGAPARRADPPRPDSVEEIEARLRSGG